LAIHIQGDVQVKTAKFDAQGGAISVSVTCDPKRDGSYDVRLWEADENVVVKPSPWAGNFVNADDDTYLLPRPNGTNNGRLLDCYAVVSVPPGVRPVRVTMRVEQDSKVLAEDWQDIPPGSPSGLVKIFMELREA
jgi:hypothetical protein